METVFKSVLPGLAVLLLVAAVGLQFAGPHGYGLVALLLGSLVACAAVIGQNPRLGVAATSSVAFAANAYLFWRKLNATGDAACKINETFDCDKINMSAWSAVGGIPITLFGMAFFAGLSMAAVMAKDEDSKRLFQLTTLFSVFNLGLSLFLGSQMFVEKAVCVVCITIYVANALLLWAGLYGLRRQNATVLDDLGAVFPSTELGLLVGAFALVFAIGLTSVWQPRSSAGGGTASASPGDIAGTYFKARGPVELDGTEALSGDPKAKFQVVEFADFACPHCAAAAKELPEILAKHPSMNLRFKTYPLTGECNPKLQPGREPITRCDAAYAAECARQQNRFWEMERMLFANQGYFAPDDLRYLADQLGLDVPKWQQCMENPATKSGILADAASGNRAGVDGTPSFFLKGATADGGWIEIKNGPPGLEAVIIAAEAGPIPPATDQPPAEE